MKKSHYILIGLLVIQLTYIVTTRFTTDDRATKLTTNTPALLVNMVDGLKIERGNQSVFLASNEGNWVIGGLNNFPANKDKIEEIISQFKKFKKTNAVTTTQAGAKKLGTGNDSFEYRVTIYSNKKEAQIFYFGKIPGFKKVYFRSSLDNNTYITEFMPHVLNPDIENWQNRDALKVSKSSISSAKINDIEIMRSNEDWTLSSLKETESANNKKLTQIIDKMTNIGFESVLGVEDKKEYRQTKPSLEFSLKTNNDEISYKISQPKKEDYYILKSSHLPHFFKINKSSVEDLKKVKRKEVVETKSSDESNSNKKTNKS